MRARRYTAPSLLLAALVFMAMALPAASEEVGTEGVSHDNGVQIRNPDNAHSQFLELYGDADDLSDLWSIQNREISTDLHFVDGNGDGSFESHMVLEQGTGRVGLGTASPAAPLEIENSSPHIQLDTVGDGSFDLFSEAGFFQIRSSETGIGPSPVLVDKDASSRSLVVDGDGVGIGTDSPQSDIDIHDVDGEAHTTFRMTAGDSGQHEWANAVRDHNGIYSFNRIGTGGGEFVVRERQHPSATLDVDGPVRATAFNTSSSKEFKTDVEPVQPGNVLAKLNELDVTSWRFKACKDGEGRLPRPDGSAAEPCSGKPTGPRHVGPMAEDFQDVFGLGDGESIATVDADGVMMAAIQSLTQQLEEKDATIAELEGEVAELKDQAATRDEQLEELEARLQALEAEDGGRADAPSPGAP